MAGQSFTHDMSDQILELAGIRHDVDFICTKKFNNYRKNIYFTDDIIQDDNFEYEDENRNSYWKDREKNNCDLNEISYLSTYCDIIIGKNSGPYVFCETKNNYFDASKTFICFSNNNDSVTLLPNTKLRCNYIVQHDHSSHNIFNTIKKELDKL